MGFITGREGTRESQREASKSDATGDTSIQGGLLTTPLFILLCSNLHGYWVALRTTVNSGSR